MKSKKLLFIFIMFVVMFLPNMVEAKSGFRHYTDSDGNIFLGGNYIEVGINKNGVFGTTDAPKEEWGFHFISGKQSYAYAEIDGEYKGIYIYLGLLSDGDGWDKGKDPVAGDFFTPGSPEERYILSYYIGDTEYNHAVSNNKFNYDDEWLSVPKVEDKSSGKTLKAEVTGTTKENVKMTLVYSFDVDDLEYKTEVKVENLGDTDITNARFVRSFDPDQDVWLNSTFSTYNKVTSNPTDKKDGSAENFAMVVARGEKTLAGVFFLSFDNRTKASRGVSFSPSNSYMPGLWDDAPVTPNKYTKEEDIEIDYEKVSELMKKGEAIENDFYDKMNELYEKYDLMDPDEFDKEYEKLCNEFDKAMEDYEEELNKNLNGYTLEDSAIALTTNFGTIAASKEDNTEFITSLDPDVAQSLRKLAALAATKDINKIVIDADKEQYYALFDGDTLVKGWLSYKDAVKGKITFDNLKQNKKYIVKTISKEDYDKENNKPKSGSQILEEEVKTLIDPLAPDEDGEEKAKVEPLKNSIIINDLSEELKYQLLDSKGNPVTDLVEAVDGKVEFNNLKSGTKYYLVGVTSDGEVSGKVLITTIGEKNPNTGDNIVKYISIFALSVVTIAVALVFNKKKKFN